MSKPKEVVTAEQVAEACLLHIDEVTAPPLDANVAFEAWELIIDGLRTRIQAAREMQVDDPQPPGDAPGP